MRIQKNLDAHPEISRCASRDSKPAIIAGIIVARRGSFPFRVPGSSDFMEADALGCQLESPLQIAALCKRHTQACDVFHFYLFGRVGSRACHGEAERANLAQADGTALAQRQDNLLLKSRNHGFDVVLRNSAVQSDKFRQLVEQHRIAQHNGRIPLEFLGLWISFLNSFVVYHKGKYLEIMFFMTERSL